MLKLLCLFTALLVPVISQAQGISAPTTTQLPTSTPTNGIYSPPAITNRSPCIQYACNTKAYNCSFRSDLDTVLAACIDVDASCVKAACSLGKDCSAPSELNDTLARCKVR